MNKEKKKRRPIFWILGSIVLLILILLLVFWGIVRYGVFRLREKNVEQAPVISEEIVEDGWEEGWVRYKGEPYAYNKDIFTFLVMGIDEMGKASKAKDGISGGQADALFLIVMNPRDKSLDVVVMNRNIMAQVDVYNKKGEYLGQHLKQIALQHGYGDGLEISCERTADAVSRIFYNLPIHGYVSINMGAIMALNHAVDGVTLTVLEDVYHNEDGFNEKLKAGEEITLTDAQAYVYTSRRDYRKFDSASGRVERQKQYIGAFAKKAKTLVQKDLTVALDLYNTISKYMVTDIDVTEFAYLVTEVLGYSFPEGNLRTLQGETVMGEKFEEFYIDEEALYELVMELFYEPVNN